MFPLVSVIIATYNGKEKRFVQTIESVLSQTYKNIELIIINDASTNNIEDVILRYCRKYDNIVYLKNEKNSERSYSRNRGIFMSKGDFIAFLDDDDIREDTDKIKKQVEFLNGNKKYVMCGTSYTIINENNESIMKVCAKSGDKLLRENILISNQFALSSVMIRKEVLFNSGFFNGEFNTAEDYDLWLRIGRYGKIDNISGSYILYRIWQGNTTTTLQTKMKKKTLKLMRINRKYYPKFYKAVILRIIDFIIPDGIKFKLLKFIKKYGVIKL